ncbi:MAG TPA: hypothetical protein PLH14_01640 [Sphaerochaeta sp.]|nr:hypothetical protein [Sphaerochaeta sp.]
MKIPPWVTDFFTKGGYIDDEGHVDTRRLLLHSVLLMVLIFALYWGASRIYLALGWNHNTKLREFVEQFGVLGVAIYVYVVDLLVLPLSVDFIWPFVLSWSFAKAIIVLGSASVAGAVTAHLFGYLISLIPLFKGWVASISGSQARRLLNRYGAWAIVISGLTPLPFSTIAMASGVVRLPVWRAVLASSVRFVRMGLYYLIVTRLIF